MAAVTGAPLRGALGRLRRARSRRARLALYIARRVLWMVPVLFFVIFFTFVLMHAAPGSPFDRGGDVGRQLSPVIVHNLEEKYGLDQPVPVQFVRYLSTVIRLDFGLSYQYTNQNVMDLILRSWPYSATLAVLAFAVIVSVAIPLGVLAALRQNTWIDFAAVGLSTVGAAVPNFVIGIVLIIILAVGMNRLTGGTVYLPTGSFGLDQHLIMPVMTLAAFPIAFIARLTRSSTLEILRQDYVRTAWAKGLREQAVVVRHVLKNSLIPVVTALGPLLAFLISGSFIVETVFAIPGIGRSFVVAVSARDYPMILATTILLSILVAVANLVVDLLYVAIDPRVRLS